MSMTAATAPGGPRLSAGPAARWRVVTDGIVIIAGALLIALVVRTFVAQAFFIPTSSMEPTLLGELRNDGSRGEGDRVIVNKLSYRLHEVRRGDVVVFERPGAADEPPPTTSPPDAARVPAHGEDDVKDLIKRVVALAGETVVIADSKVFVNGAPLDEPYLPVGTATIAGPGGRTWTHRCTLDDPCTVPAGNVWVMGDNRLNSKDSRYLGPIPEDAIIGRAVAIMWPFDRTGGL